jgi:uncharacterized DUF497 family protein
MGCRKYAANLQKHGVKFEDAAQVLFDPFCQFGDASVEDERREFVVGFRLVFSFIYGFHRTRRKSKNNLGTRNDGDRKENYARRK